MMDTCKVCGTKLTTLRDKWVHLNEEYADHRPMPKEHKTGKEET